jgi:predicted O-methyltransferase YrrM
MEKLLNVISHDQYLVNIDEFCHSAWIGHAPFLKFLIREIEPRVFVELGVHYGFSYFLGCQAIKECELQTKAFAVDHWIGDEQAGFFDSSVFASVKEKNIKYQNFSTLLKMSFDEALSNFEDGSIDLLHIDGFHSYESVSKDFNSWLPKMGSNGIVLLHDIHVRRNTFGVHRFWEETKANFRTIEFVGSHGLGVVLLGAVNGEMLKQVIEIAESGFLNQIQGTFGSISDDVIQGSRNGMIRNLSSERDSALAERDSALAERDSALAERDMILNSNTWKLLKPYRRFIQLLVEK